MEEIFELKDCLIPGEQILWKGKPSSVPFVLSSYPGFLIGLILLIFLVLIFIYPVFKYEVSPKEFVPIWLLLIIPWIFLALFFLSYPILALKVCKTQEYILTNKRVLMIHGSNKENRLLIPIAKVSKADVQIGLFGKFFNTANIRLRFQNHGYLIARHNQYFYSITNYEDFKVAAKNVFNN